MKPAAFHYHVPLSIDEAVALLGQLGRDARLLAGGQSLVPAMTSRLLQPTDLIDLNRIALAERPSVADGHLVIPPLMRHVDFAAGVAAAPLGPLLAELAGAISTWPVRLRGTVCGALAHAHPASLWGLAAVALGAQMLARSAHRGERPIASDAFFESMMVTALADDEMLVAVRVPLLASGTRWGFAKVTHRAGDYALAGALVLYTLKEGRVVDPRIAICGVEAVPRRIAAAETALEGRAPGERACNTAAECAAEAVDPAETTADERDHRRDLTRAVVLNALRRTMA